MRRLKRCARRVATVGCLVLFSLSSSWAQQPPPQQPPLPFAPDWALLAGWDVYVKKGCGQCHGVRSGSEGRAAPDLARIQNGTGFFELGAAMWNHLPLMGTKMREVGIERPTLTPLEVSNVLAFIFTAQYSDEQGNATTGERLFTGKRCVQCHSVGGKGGNVGPALDFLKRSNSAVLVAARMWNHGSRMAETMQAKGIERPTFKRNELVDIIAYITATAKDPGGDSAQIVPGTPERGEQLFGDKQCAACHTIGGKGGKVGPGLGRAHHISLTQFAGLMWNHGPVMWARMKERGIEVPQLTGQEMADIVAYLYTSHYFDPAAGSSAGGQRLLQTKGCLACHSVGGKGGKVAGDFATSSVVGSPTALVAAMWNNSRAMEDQAQKQGMKLPTLKGQELADMSAYLRSLTKARATPQTK
jgi:mono/diheme cytochrome c family protein